MTNKSNQNIMEAVVALTALITTLINESQDDEGKLKASKFIKKLNKLQDQMVEIVTKAIPKKEKKLKDPEAPKKPMTAYIIFSKEQRPRIKEENPDAKPAELMSIIGKEWKSLSDKEKKPYQKKSEKLKAVYVEEKKGYKPKSPEDIEALVKAEKERKKASRKVEGVTGAKNAWIFFQTEQRAKLKGKVESSEMMATLAEKWKKIKDTKKAEKYKKMAEEDKVRFEREAKDARAKEKSPEVKSPKEKSPEVKSPKVPKSGGKEVVPKKTVMTVEEEDVDVDEEDVDEEDVEEQDE